MTMLYITLAFAGDVIIHDKSQPYDPFAVRDKKKADHQWQQQQQLQQQIQLIQSLPVGCLLIAMPFKHYRCGGQFYRPIPPIGSDTDRKVQPQYQLISPPQNN